MSVKDAETQTKIQTRSLSVFQTNINYNAVDGKKKKKESIAPPFNLKKGGSIYLKILMNYLQIIAIIQSIDLRWPFYADDFLKANSQVASITNEVLSFDCVLYDYEIKEDPIHAKALIGFMLPIILFFIISFIFIMSFLKNGKNQKNRIIMGLVVLCIFLQPSILKQLFDNLNCKKIGDYLYLSKQMNLKCDDENHQKWVNLSSFSVSLSYLFYF